MVATYRLNVNELTLDFFKLLKKIYNGKSVSITVEEEMDETEYLLTSPANREALLKRVKDVQEGKNPVTVNPKDL